MENRIKNFSNDMWKSINNGTYFQFILDENKEINQKSMTEFADKILGKILGFPEQYLENYEKVVKEKNIELAKTITNLEFKDIYAISCAILLIENNAEDIIDNELLDGMLYCSFKTSGKNIKEYNFNIPTPDNVKKELSDNIKDCDDDKFYYLPALGYFFHDIYSGIHGKCTEEKIILNQDYLKKANYEAPKRFLYAILPNEDIRIIPTGYEEGDKFIGNIHTFLTCGSPVICAGLLDIYDCKIIYISPESGHYKPDLEALRNAINIFHKKKLININEFSRLEYYFRD